MKLLIVGDPHIKYTAPTFRKETYFQELKDKINQINIIAKENNAKVFCLGDFFNSYVEDYFELIVYELADMIYGWQSLIGNHDCKSVDGNLKGTSFGVLVQMDTIKIPNCGSFDYFHYFNREKFTGKSINQVAFIHDYIMPSGTKENFEYKECFENDYEIVFAGHWHCFSDDTEVLTKDGWKYFKELRFGDSVLTLNVDKSNKLAKNILEWNKINKIIHNKHTGDMINIKSSQCDILVTPEHRLISKHGSWSAHLEFTTANKAFESISKYPVSGELQTTGIELSDDEIRFVVWCISDGSIDRRSINFRFRKERKVLELIDLLKRMNILYTTGTYKDGCQRIHISSKNILLKKVFGLIGDCTDKKHLPVSFKNANKHQAKIIFDTYGNTDGHIYRKNYLQLSTSKKIEADILQELFTVNGFSCNYFKRSYSNKNHKDSYILRVIKDKNFICLSPNNNFHKVSNYNDDVWCVNVNNSTVLVRRHGKVIITGNCPYDVKVGKTRYINPGSLMRSTVKELELNRTPEVILFNSDTLEVKHIPLKVKPLVDVANILEENKLDKTFESKFADMLLKNDLTGDNRDIINLLKKNNIESSIISYIEQKLEEVK